MSTPVGSLLSSHRMTPPSCCMSQVRPTLLKPSPFTIMACPSIRSKTTGTFGNKESKVLLLGHSACNQSFWSQPLPRIQAEGCSFACETTFSSTSSQESVPTKSASSKPSAYPIKWAWASIKPGVTTPPRKSICTGARYLFRICLFAPISTMRPSLIANAWAIEFSGSKVKILPLWTMQSASSD